MDKNAFRYRARVSVQMDQGEAVARKEVVTELQDMVFNHLSFYCEHRRRPQRIIVYRDGVGEGQFKEVQAKEVDAIKKACKRISPKYDPPVTFIIVQKRHHTRFLPIFDEQPVNVNVPPGTTVENVITHPGHLNFFLCSHQGLIGTSRPAHYHVLCKESAHTLQQLQHLTFDLCHLVARCTRSVSIPSPVYYAHLAAFRAKNHIQGSGLSREAHLEDYKVAVKVHDNIVDEMYFV
nr:protein argonaute-2-like [Rhipicephalus microplus]